MNNPVSKQQTLHCYHCGDRCAHDKIQLDEKVFCCEGCRLVYELLQENALCDYYELNQAPGNSRKKPVRKDQFACLDLPEVASGFICFSNEQFTKAQFYLPQIHCSSCLWLLENLSRVNPGILGSEVNFFNREIIVSFDHQRISLRDVAETLASVGYEPYISLDNLDEKPKKPGWDKSKILKLGVAGFCFGNIMLMSLPEYFSNDIHVADSWAQAFRYINLGLALPVFFYSATEFYRPAWQGIRKRFLNIDIPVCLAIIITFVRSVVEVATQTGPGFFDSFAGIVFFMLAGRVMQDRTFRKFSFERDYRSYFPVAVNKVTDGKEIAVTLPRLNKDDIVVIHHGELVPADALLLKGDAQIDYSFVTGESLPVGCRKGDIVYAGGKQTGGNIYLKLIKKVSQSYLTSLWNRRPGEGEEKNKRTFVEQISGIFTMIVLFITLKTAMYWSFFDPGKIWPSVTAILIIACPCVLLLASTYTNGHFLRIFAHNGLFVRNAGVLETLRKINRIVLDKTGTLTRLNERNVSFHGRTLSDHERNVIISLAMQSTHPLSRSLAVAYEDNVPQLYVESFKEYPGRGIEGWIDDHHVRIGNASFILPPELYEKAGPEGNPAETAVWVAIDEQIPGYFTFESDYRPGIGKVLDALKDCYKIALLSGDSSEADRRRTRQLLGGEAEIRFHQSPRDKRDYVSSLQLEGHQVLMIGDGLNDAGALRQSEAGIAVTENVNNFSPACDAILEAGSFHLLPAFLRLAHINKRIIMGTFIFSVIYNITGLYFAVQGLLSPVIAAVIMPLSSLSIILMTYMLSEWAGKRAIGKERLHSPTQEHS